MQNNKGHCHCPGAFRFPEKGEFLWLKSSQTSSQRIWRKQFGKELEASLLRTSFIEVSEGAMQAPMGEKQPIVISSSNTKRPQQGPTWKDNLKGAVVALITQG